MKMNTTRPVSLSKAATHVQGLDSILHGGLPLGRATMISGGAGTGKTVLAMEILYRWSLDGQPGVFVSFEERTGDLRINAASMGMDIQSLEQTERFRLVHAEVPHGAIRAGEFDIKGMLAIIEQHTRAAGASRLVLDAIDVLMRLFGDPEKEREELHILLDWLRERDMTVLLTVKARPDGRQVYPFLDFMADCILFLDQRMQGQVRTRRLNVIKYRGSGFLSNEHPYVLSSRGVVLMPVSSMTLEHQKGEGWVSSGNSQLDSILGGGYLQGSSILLAGDSGTGKTTLAFTFTSAACRRQEKVLYINFEESQPALIRGMKSVGIDVKGPLEKGTLEILTTLPESVGIENHLLNIMEAIENFSPAHLVVDAVSACRRMGTERAAFDFLVRLLTECRNRNITCFLINQVRHDQQVMEISGFGISSLVDTLLLMEYEYKKNRISRKMVVIKSRGAHHSMNYHPFRITDRGIEVEVSKEDGYEK